MGEYEDIKQAFGRAASRFGPAAIQPATVQTVDAEAMTADVLLQDDTPVEAVRLRAVINEGDYYVQLPAPGSEVLIGRLHESEDYAVLLGSEYSEVKLAMGSLQYSLTGDGLQLTKGSANLKQALVKMIEAVEQVVVLHGNNPDYVKLTEAKTMINNLLR